MRRSFLYDATIVTHSVVVIVKIIYTVYLHFYIFISIKKLRIQQGYGAIIMHK